MGEAISQDVLNCFKSKEIITKTLVLATSYGAPRIKEMKNGFVTLLMNSLNQKLPSFQC